MTDFIIRTPRPEEANAMAEIEALGFAPAEAASLAQITARLAVFPEQFFVAEQDNRVVGFINGCSADTPHLPDKFYADANHHVTDALQGLLKDLDFRLRLFEPFDHVGAVRAKLHDELCNLQSVSPPLCLLSIAMKYALSFASSASEISRRGASGL